MGLGVLVNGSCERAACVHNLDSDAVHRVVKVHLLRRDRLLYLFFPMNTIQWFQVKLFKVPPVSPQVAKPASKATVTTTGLVRHACMPLPCLCIRQGEGSLRQGESLTVLHAS